MWVETSKWGATNKQPLVDTPTSDDYAPCWERLMVRLLLAAGMAGGLGFGCTSGNEGYIPPWAWPLLRDGAESGDAGGVGDDLAPPAPDLEALDLALRPPDLQELVDLAEQELARLPDLVPADLRLPLTPPAAGLVGRWSFDGAGAADESGNGNDATVHGATRVPGRVGMAYRFDGSACITVPASASLEMEGGSALTTMAWVNYAGGCSDLGTILDKSGEYGQYVRCDPPTVKEDLATTADLRWQPYGNHAITLNAWHLLARTWDGATVRQYVDAVETDSRPLAGTLSASLVLGRSGLGIGCANLPPSGALNALAYPFVGTIDEVSVYDRALSPAEVGTYYQATK